MSKSDSAPKSDSVDSASPAEALFSDYLRRRDSGETITFERFVRDHPEHSDELRVLERNWARVGGVLERLTGGASSAPSRSSVEELRARLSQRASPYERYEVEAEIERGGMGAIVRAQDRDLRRPVAMKIVLDTEPTLDPIENSARARRLVRFLDEAQITGQLDHPGIVPVHELGLDPNGRLYFTMKLVGGRNLRGIFDLVRTGAEGWNKTRALGVLLRVCEAMAFAHERGVIHRDLKPANVMVGRHGETYVMDWGLARVMGESDAHDLRIRDGAPELPRVRAERHESADRPSGSPLVTMDGDVLGTPHYMSPEQARGDVERMGPASDVYAVGAMLYELLAGAAPYESGDRASPHAIWRRVLEGPPLPLARRASKESPELVAICEKAMAREPAARYPDMSQLAEDLRRFLEHRVVRAHRTGALVELQKWVQRNPAAAGLLVTLGVVIAGAGYVSTLLERARQRERVALLSRAYTDEFASAWPMHPKSIPEMERWLAGARQIVDWLPSLKAERDELREQGTPFTELEWRTALAESPLRAEILNAEYLIENAPDQIREAKERLESSEATEAERADAGLLIDVLEAERSAAEERLSALTRRFREPIGWRFPTAELARSYDSIAAVVARLENLIDPSYGSIAATERRLEHVRDLERRTVVEYADLWDRVIADVAADEPYGGYALEPQIGLVPLRQHPSGLWEFWLEPSGERPVLDGATDEWQMRPETGLVLILVPGGSFLVGAQAEYPAQPNYDRPPQGIALGALQQVEIDPFFLSKYEVTQAQWERLCGERPSTFAVGQDYLDARPITATHPVETVAMAHADRALAAWGLRVPTIAQWERAARCGMDLPFGGYDVPEVVPETANIADTTLGTSMKWPTSLYDASRKDGYLVHAPVDRTEPSGWGFFGLLGNVSEWTRDLTSTTGLYASAGEPVEIQPGTGEFLAEYGNQNEHRGANYRSLPASMRVAARTLVARGYVDPTVGVRPCRLIESAQSGGTAAGGR